MVATTSSSEPFVANPALDSLTPDRLVELEEIGAIGWLLLLDDDPARTAESFVHALRGLGLDPRLLDVREGTQALLLCPSAESVAVAVLVGIDGLSRLQLEHLDLLRDQIQRRWSDLVVVTTREGAAALHGQAPNLASFFEAEPPFWCDGILDVDGASRLLAQLRAENGLSDNELRLQVEAGRIPRSASVDAQLALARGLESTEAPP